MCPTFTLVAVTGGTYTNLALDTARTTFFSGHSNAKRLVILVTDGQSASTILTAAAAQRLKVTQKLQFSQTVNAAIFKRITKEFDVYVCVCVCYCWCF